MIFTLNETSISVQNKNKNKNLFYYILSIIDWVISEYDNDQWIEKWEGKEKCVMLRYDMKEILL